jgi:hypothetical protein
MTMTGDKKEGLRVEALNQNVMKRLKLTATQHQWTLSDFALSSRKEPPINMTREQWLVFDRFIASTPLKSRGQVPVVMKGEEVIALPTLSLGFSDTVRVVAVWARPCEVTGRWMWCC